MKPVFLFLILLSGCATQHKPCNVERITSRYRVEMLDSLDRHPSMTMDLLQTIARLENEAGGYE